MIIVDNFDAVTAYRILVLGEFVLGICILYAPKERWENMKAKVRFWTCCKATKPHGLARPHCSSFLNDNSNRTIRHYHAKNATSIKRMDEHNPPMEPVLRSLHCPLLCDQILYCESNGTTDQDQTSRIPGRMYSSGAFPP